MNRKYYIKTMIRGSIDCSGHACLQIKCAHRFLATRADQLALRADFVFAFGFYKTSSQILGLKYSFLPSIRPLQCLPKSLKILRMNLRLYMKI